MSDFTRYFATDIITDRNGACEIKHAWVSIAPSTSNSAIIAGVTGKKLRILNLTVGSGGNTQNMITLRNGSGGGNIGAINYPANTSASPMVIYPTCQEGWLETGTGLGLYADVAAGTGNCNIGVTYVEVTP